MLLLCGYLLHKNRCSSHGFSSESRAIRTVRLYVSHLQRTRCIYHNVLWWSHCSYIYLFKNCSSLSLFLSYYIFDFICPLFSSSRSRTFCSYEEGERPYVQFAFEQGGNSTMSHLLCQEPSVSAVSSEGTLTLKQQARGTENLFYAEFFTFG